MPRASRVLAVALSAVLGVAGGAVTGHLLAHPAPAPDPLGLGVSLVNQPCTGQSLLVTSTGTSDAALSAAAAEDPSHTRYLSTDHSCDTAWRQNGVRAHGFVTYLGPYRSVGQACQERMTVAHRGDMVARLRAGGEPVQCLCYLDYATFPTLRLGMSNTAQIGIYVRAMQKLLVTAKLNPADRITGLYDDQTVAQVTTFQGEAGLPQNGVVDGPTWHQLLSKTCAG